MITERIVAATRGVRFPAELSELLTWATYNHADRHALRELSSLPWRSYRDVSDVVDQINRTRRELGGLPEVPSPRVVNPMRQETDRRS